MTVEAIRIETGAHVVHFYEDDADAVATMAGYVIGAIKADEAALVIASGHHREALDARLDAAGIDVAEARRTETLVTIDSAAILARFYTDGQIVADHFRSELGGTIRRIAQQTGRPVRCYGEMVALLWDAGAVAATIELEEDWNDLSRELAFSLLCSYPNTPDADYQHSYARWDVCLLHSDVVDPRPGTERHFRTRQPGTAEMLATFAAQTELSRLKLEPDVHQALGMVAVQLGVNTGEALNRLRRFATDHGKTLDEVVAEVINRQLVHGPTPGPH